MYGKTLGQEVIEDIAIYKDNDIEISRVFTGSFIAGNIQEITNILDWGKGDCLTLSEIRKQTNEKIVTVIQLSALSGNIYQCGNTGDSWIYQGKLNGYA